MTSEIHAWPSIQITSCSLRCSPHQSLFTKYALERLTGWQILCGSSLSANGYEIIHHPLAEYAVIIPCVISLITQAADE